MLLVFQNMLVQSIWRHKKDHFFAAFAASSHEWIRSTTQHDGKQVADYAITLLVHWVCSLTRVLYGLCTRGRSWGQGIPNIVGGFGSYCVCVCVCGC